MLIMTILLFILSILFLLSSHPLIMSFLLILTTINYSVMIYLMSLTPWLTYILIMVFVSGMMVMFIYMASLSSNEPIYLLFKPFQKLFLMLLMYSITFFILTKPMKNNQMFNSINQFNNEYSMELIYKTYNKLMLELTSLLIIYLLIVLIVSMNIINNFKKPLRSNK